MPAVIQRVATSPTVHTEYLSSLDPEKWAGKKPQAHIFPTHAVADGLAKLMRERADVRRRETGELDAAFIHARTIGNDELNEFKGIPEPEKIKVPELDAKRLREIEMEEAYR